jgi:hypothetical protein
MASELQKLEWELFEAAQSVREALDYRDADWLKTLLIKAGKFIHDVRKAVEDDKS